MILTAHSSDAGWKRQWPQIVSQPVLLCVMLFVATVLIFWPVTTCDFTNYDDPDYFTANHHVLTGLKAENVAWAFTTGQTGNWHPLTWLSLMLDAQLFGPKPLGPHLTNLFFHALNVGLLFLLLRTMTEADGLSAGVAALFAWHPLHVESVAWVAERKDVLSTFFGLLAMLSYACYGQTNRRWSYIFALICFAFSLLAKPMLVTLPFVLLLLDWWPLQRFYNGRAKLPLGPIISHDVIPGKELTDDLTNPAEQPFRPAWQCLVGEKIPFLALSIISSVITFIVQQKGGAVSTLNGTPLSNRMENTFVSYARYLGKTVWPEPLANPYPYQQWDWPMIIFSLLLVIGLSVLAVLSVRKYPYVFTGWFWFVGTLIPVIGLVQVGIQSMADRYTYIPLIGVFIIFVWGLAEVSAKLSLPKAVMTVVMIMLLAACALQTRAQLGYWKNNETLFRHTLAVTKNNYLAYNNLGTWLSKNGNLDEAMNCFNQSLQINPTDPEVHYNLANAFAKLGQWDAAIDNYQYALQLRPNQADMLDNLGFALFAKKQYTNAINCFVASLKIDPDASETHNNLATVLFIGHDFAQAEEHYRAAIRLTPDNPQIYVNLGDTLVRENKINEAVQNYQQALALRPDDERTKMKLKALTGG